MNNVGQAATVFIVDDDKEILRSYELTLKNNQITNITLLDDSRKVMKAVYKENPCLIILDLAMPYISGSELLVKLNEEYPEIPHLILDPSAFPEGEREAYLDIHPQPHVLDWYGETIADWLTTSDLLHP